MGNLNKNPKKKYFSSINKILTKKNCYNYFLTDNLNICLSEKNFDQVPDASIQYITLEEGQPTNFIYWLDFIYFYLSKEKSLKRYWPDQMIAALEKENFLSENKYLSEFFMEEFEIENAPDCLFKKESKKEKKEKINFDNSLLNVTQNLGGSFMNSENNSQYSDIAHQKYKHFRDKVKGYVYKFKEHILNRDHPINRVTQIFAKIWVKYAETIINSLEAKNLNDKFIINEINSVVDELTQELQRFVVHLQIALKLFYSRTINYAYFNEEKDELINLITTLLFRTGDIYSTIFDLYKLSLNQELKKIYRNFQELKKVTPEDLGINKQYCLNIISLNFQEEILLKKLNEIENKQIRDDEIVDTDFEKKKIGILLEVVRDNKKKVPRYGDREIEETKVNLDYEENYNLISNQKPKPINELDKLEKSNTISVSRIEEELGDGRMSLFPIQELDDEVNDLIISNGFSQDKDQINTSENEITKNKTMIIRTKREKSIKGKIAKLPKVFNRVSYTRTKNIEYLSYPYETAIQLLKQIQKYHTPFEKMMIFASISSEITDCVNDFWKGLNEYIDNDLLNLEIEQLMTIFIYIIIQAQIPDISVHCKIIKSFTTCITKASMIGYYYSTVEASVLYISSINDVKELIKNKNNK